MPKTEELIRKLAENGTPVQRPTPPYVRAVMWLAVSLAYIAVFVLLMYRGGSSNLHDPFFFIEQVAALATGFSAALAAFATVVPGYSQRWMALPLLPLAVWLASLGPACLQELNQSGIQNLPLTHNPLCGPFIVLFGTLPAVAITLMLRRGAPLTPHRTAALGGLAAAGLANVGVRIVHPEDVTIMLLVWHIGTVMVLSALAGAAGRYFFDWSYLIKKAKF